MYICVSCRREMLCEKNAVGADFGFGHVYPGDKFQCPTCGRGILATNRKPVYDRDYSMLDAYISVSDKGKTDIEPPNQTYDEFLAHMKEKGPR